MLINLKPIGDNLQAVFNEVHDWPEVRITQEVKVALEKLSFIKKVHDSSVCVTTSETTQTIFPSQYLLYAVLFKEFAINFYEYIKVLDSLKSNGLNNSDINALIATKDLNSSALNNLDMLERKFFYQVFNVENMWDAKQILSNNNGKSSIRTSSDFFGSVLLKLINVPQSSNAILGEFIYELCRNTDVFNVIEESYIKHLPLLYKSSNRGLFCADVLRFCHQYDHLDAIKKFFRANSSQEENITIELDSFRLTSIFKTSLNLLDVSELTLGDKPRFFSEPIFKIDKKYYYLSTEWTSGKESRLDLVSFKRIIERCYPFITIDLGDSSVFIMKPNSNDAAANSFKAGGSNLIYFGPPGTGKSYQAKRESEGGLVTRTLFHPEYTYSDFVGSYRPVIGRDEAAPKISSYDHQSIYRPVNYFEFVPGPLILSLCDAFNNPARKVCLVIDELNRGECSAIFGDFFQLLDRDVNGASEYGLELKIEVKNFFLTRNIKYNFKNDGQLYFPSNFHLIATINTSDQSLYPIDTAFKRRWEWISCPINFSELLPLYPSGLFLNDGNQTWSWERLITSLNILISKNHMEDKQLGPWFIKPNADGEIEYEVFLNKCLYYLWHDVYRGEQFGEDSPFENSEKISCFSDLQEVMRVGGLSAGFKSNFLQSII